ncbi:MAG: ABC transporter permease [Planctomycetes bacterium]|nr:ABC transporter permease [Planctomycetota bacterium]
MTLRGLLRALCLIVRRNLAQHALSSTVTALASALGCGLVIAVVVVREQAHDAFVGGPVGFDAVLGARGSQLQLVLNTVFHLETSPGNIPWSMYEDVRKDPQVELAIPYALGDNYRGWRIVGTTPEIFTRFEYRKGRRFQAQPGGRFFDPKLREAVIGSLVAQRTGMRVGTAFHPQHGVADDREGHHEEEYVVVGVLEPTNSPSDRVIWIPIEGIFRMGGHVLHGAGETFVPQPGEKIPEEAKEVSAVMLKLRTPMAGFRLDQKINREGTAATLAWPIGKSLAELFEKLGWMDRVLALVAWLVMAVAAASILASLYNAMNERRRDFAILRALGAKRRVVFSAILLESTAIAGFGALGGLGISTALIAGAAHVVRSQTGVVIQVFAFHPVQFLAPAAMVALGALVGIVPALKAYRTPVAENLVPQS